MDLYRKTGGGFRFRVTTFIVALERLLDAFEEKRSLVSTDAT